MAEIFAKVSGIGGYVPDHILTNQMLENMVDTTDEWITARTGIKERRLLKGDGLATSDMAKEAVLELLQKTNTKPEEVDLLICGTVTPDMPFPSTANIICDKAGLHNAFSYDVGAACSGFIFSLWTGAQFVRNGTYKKVIVVGADKMSSIIDYEDRATCIIFGDGAGAVMLEPTDERTGVLDAAMYSDGAGREFLHQKAGGSLNPANHGTVDRKEHFVYQDGKVVFKNAVEKMADVSEEIMKRNNLSSEDIAWLVPHQANLRIIDATRSRVGLPEDRVMINIQKFGNTTSGTIPLCLWEWEKKLKKGDNMILSAFGGGFTWGAIYLKWSYDS